MTFWVKFLFHLCVQLTDSSFLETQKDLGPNFHKINLVKPLEKMLPHFLSQVFGGQQIQWFGLFLMDLKTVGVRKQSNVVQTI